MAAGVRSSDRSADRRGRRSHRSRSHSPPASRSRRSSHRRSSKRRSVSRSRERSRRSGHHHHSRRHHRSRSRSHSRERHKRRRRDSDDKRIRRSGEETERKVAITSSSAPHSQDSQAEKAATNADKTQVNAIEDVAMKDASEPQKEAQLTQTLAKIAVHEGKDKKTTVDKEKQTNSVATRANTPKPALDVSSIKADVLKALADARSTIAVIKKSGASTSVATTPTPSSVSVTVEQEEQEKPVESPEKQQKEVVQSPPKTTPSPQKTAIVADEFDMFSMAALDDHNDAMNSSAGVAAVTVDEVALQSNCDDSEGYYSTTIGEVLNGKYRVLGAVGKGVFSTVLRCHCITPLETDSGGSLSVVAVKLIRNNDVMRDAAQTELKLLKELGERDPRDKKHCIRLLDSFTHRNHVAMVFEPMQMNVREAMKKFGGKGGISIQAVRVFSKHLLIALNHLESCGVIHADIKPDNVLLDEKQTTIKLCDFGSAFKADNGKQDPTPYLVSRFYRAPEIVLGLAYDKAVDMWSVGCCLYEMFTGKVMFPGSTNNEMLKLFMELKGKIPNKLIKKHRQAYIDQFEMEPHFTEDLKFCSRESDRVTGKPILRLMDNIKTKNDLAGSLMAAKSTTDDRKQVLELRSLLDRMFTLDPSKRISLKDALAHSFMKGS
ncbi:Protein kinase, ATP binding site [Phytophthora cactorum]|nr:Protein kinase, ATP binding site [Phytophthora cactorum]